MQKLKKIYLNILISYHGGFAYIALLTSIAVMFIVCRTDFFLNVWTGRDFSSSLLAVCMICFLIGKIIGAGLMIYSSFGYHWEGKEPDISRGVFFSRIILYLEAIVITAICLYIWNKLMARTASRLKEYFAIPIRDC